MDTDLSYLPNYLHGRMLAGSSSVVGLFAINQLHEAIIIPDFGALLAKAQRCVISNARTSPSKNN